MKIIILSLILIIATAQANVSAKRTPSVDMEKEHRKAKKRHYRKPYKRSTPHYIKDSNSHSNKRYERQNSRKGTMSMQKTTTKKTTTKNTNTNKRRTSERRTSER